MNKTILSSVAAVAFAISTPAFAQDPASDTDVEKMVEETKDATQEVMDDMEDMADDAADEMDDMIELTEEELEETGEDMTEEVEEIDSVIGCPDGTEAQDDGSCLITGDWSADD